HRAGCSPRSSGARGGLPAPLAEGSADRRKGAARGGARRRPACMIRARLLGVLTAVVFIGTAIPASATIAAGGPEPELHLQTDVLTPGQSVAITGSGWPTGSTLQAVLCGANAVDGSTDCAQAAAATMSPGPNGVVDGVLRVLSPPQPCPCVVVVSSLPPA